MIERILLCMLVVFFPLSGLADSGCYDVIPMPRKIQLSEGQAPFQVSRDTRILFYPSDAEMERNASFLSYYINRYTGVDIPVVPCKKIPSEKEGCIVLKCDPALDIHREGYRAEIGGRGVVIEGKTPSGVFYGVQMLRKALPSGQIRLDAAVVEDAPVFGYRGAHLDVSRHFFSVEQVKCYIDMMALHNMNVLHWHITDDQGWRVEIKRYPDLTRTGSVRSETLVGHLNDRPEVYDGKPYGGYYTQEEVRDIVTYAKERYIEVVPEVDLPGHMQAALAAYPELGCTGGPYKVWTKWGISPDVLCAGNDAVLEFLDGVFAEVVDLFPGQYVHIGGDECPKIRWESCPKCQAKAVELGLSDDAHATVEQKLQSYIMNHVTDYLQKHGRKIIGWDEILEGGIDKEAIVMSWRGEKGGIAAANLGHDVVMTPNSHMYFDFYQGRDTENEPLAIGGYIPVRKVYEYNPVPESLDSEKARHIIGLQANLWTEYIADFSHIQYMVLPRWAALSENQWACPQKKDYKAFLDRLARLVRIYEIEGYNFAPHVFEVVQGIRPDFGKGCIKVAYTTMGDASVHYTLDGSFPSMSSPVAEDSIIVCEDAVLTAAAFRNGKPGKVCVDTVRFNKATARPVVLSCAPSSKYAFDGARMLVDGLRGDVVFGSGRWLGFDGSHLEAVVDMGNSCSFSSVGLGVCVNTADGVFDARRITVSVSDDGVSFRTVADREMPQIQKETKCVRRHILPFDEVSARYVKVVAEPESVIPQWSWLSGARAFLFCDELEVE